MPKSSEARKKLWRDPAYRKKMTDMSNKLWKDPKYLAKISESMKRRWRNPEYRSKVIRKVSKPRRAGFGAEQSKRIKQWYQDHPEQRELRRIHMRKTWAQGKITPVRRASNRSAIEREFVKALIDISPDKVQLHRNFRTNKRTWILPDAFIPDMELAIEFYGDYWHANPSMFSAGDMIHNSMRASDIWARDSARINRLKNCDGVSEVIVVWEKDYKQDRDAVLQGAGCNIKLGVVRVVTKLPPLAVIKG